MFFFPFLSQSVWVLFSHELFLKSFAKVLKSICVVVSGKFSSNAVRNDRSLFYLWKRAERAFQLSIKFPEIEAKNILYLIFCSCSHSLHNTIKQQILFRIRKRRRKRRKKKISKRIRSGNLSRCSIFVKSFLRLKSFHRQ